LERALVLGVARFAGGAEANDDLVADPDAAIELDPVLLPIALGDDAEHLRVVNERVGPGVERVPLDLLVEELRDRVEVPVDERAVAADDDFHGLEAHGISLALALMR